MPQILVTVDSEQPLQGVQQAIRMLCGVVSTSVVKETDAVKTRKQEARVKRSLTKAFKELSEAEEQGTELPDARDLFK